MYKPFTWTLLLVLISFTLLSCASNKTDEPEDSDMVADGDIDTNIDGDAVDNKEDMESTPTACPANLEELGYWGSDRERSGMKEAASNCPENMVADAEFGCVSSENCIGLSKSLPNGSCSAAFAGIESRCLEGKYPTSTVSDLNEEEMIFVNCETGRASSLGTADDPLLSLQKGIDRAIAQNGKAVLIGAGVCRETIEIEGADGLTIAGLGEYRSTIDAEGLNEPVVTIRESTLTLSHVRISGGRVANVYIGRSASSDDVVELSNVLVERSDAIGIKLFNMEGTFRLYHSVIRDCPAFGILSENSNLDISNNYIHDIANDGQTVNVDAVRIRGLASADIRYNRFADSGGLGITREAYTGSLQPLSVTNNSIEWVGASAIYAAGVSGEIGSNRIQEIRMQKSAGFGGNCDLETDTGCLYGRGIDIEDESDVAIQNNIISGCHEMGIYTNHSAAIISGNSVTGTQASMQYNGGWGVLVTEASEVESTIEVKTNYIQANGAGIGSLSNAATIEGNVLANNAYAGIEMRDTGLALVRHNTITGTTAGEFDPESGIGIVVRFADNDIKSVDIVGNTISGNTADGILIGDGGDADIRENTVTDNGDSGILFNDSYGSILAASHNTISGHSFDGQSTDLVIQGDSDVETDLYYLSPAEALPLPDEWLPRPGDLGIVNAQH